MEQKELIELGSASEAGPTEQETERIISRFGSPKRIITLLLISAIGGYLMMLTLATALQLRLTSMDTQLATTIYSRIVTLAGILMLFAVPLVGALSDCTTSRFGRRRPWILGGYLLTLCCMLGIGSFNNYWIIGLCYIIGIVSAQTSFNVFMVIPVEAIPNQYRGRVMGMMGVIGALAMPAGAALAGKLVDYPVLMMSIPVLGAVITTIPLWLGYPDPKCDKSEVPELKLGSIFSSIFVSPRRHPNFILVWLACFTIASAMTAFLSFFVLYLVTNLHYTPGEAGAKAGLLFTCSAPISIILFASSGWLSDKLGRRKPFIIGAAVIMAIALGVGILAKDFSTFTIAWMIFAVGQPMFLTVYLALCAQVLPNAADTGKDMAVFNLAQNLPTILVPAVAPFLLGANNNYALLWGLAAGLALIGAVITLLVRGVK